RKLQPRNPRAVCLFASERSSRDFSQANRASQIRLFWQEMSATVSLEHRGPSATRAQFFRRVSFRALDLRPSRWQILQLGPGPRSGESPEYFASASSRPLKTRSARSPENRRPTSRRDYAPSENRAARNSRFRTVHSRLIPRSTSSRRKIPHPNRDFAEIRRARDARKIPCPLRKSGSKSKCVRTPVPAFVPMWLAIGEWFVPATRTSDRH